MKTRRVAVSNAPLITRTAYRFPARRVPSSMRPARSASHARIHWLPGMEGFAQGGGGVKERAVVVTVRDAVTGSAPLGVTEDGETTQVASCGAPVQLNATVWLNAP